MKKDDDLKALRASDDFKKLTVELEPPTMELIPQPGKIN
jgi:hypothetical protein